MMNRYCSLLLLFVGIFSACKKDKVDGTEKPPLTTDRTELTKDSIFLYAKEVYYWNDALPSYSVFAPRSYNSKEAELFAITQTKINPSTNKPYEYSELNPSAAKYSFFDETNGGAGVISALDSKRKAILEGDANDFGFDFFYNTSTDLRVSVVYPNSPAWNAGLKRGYRITRINNLANVNYSNVANVENAISDGTSLTLTVAKPDGTTQTLTMLSASYAVNPIVYKNVYTVGSKKVGYMVFNTFTVNAKTYLDEALSYFSSNGITELIVDLRYDGGGYISSAEVMTNMIAPSSQTGKVMYSAFYNSTLQGLNTLAKRKGSILVNQPLTDENGNLQTDYKSGVNGKFATYADIDFRPTKEADNVISFAKVGALNISTVYFLVTGNTASASELVINNLKAVMNVKLIGQKTYGKPVGFFPIHIDTFDMYIPEFETKNQLNVGGYYDGLPVDKTVSDDLTRDFGDTNEAMLANAIYHSANGSFSANLAVTALATTSGRALSSTEVKQLTDRLSVKKFNGMILDKKFKLAK